jgi:hypothetical protein
MGGRVSYSPIAAASLLASILFILLFTTVTNAQLGGQNLGNLGGLGGAGGGTTGTNPLGAGCSGLGQGILTCFSAAGTGGSGAPVGDYGYGYGICIPYAYCTFTNESSSYTFYTYSAGNGKIVRSTISGTVSNPIPVISDVITNNNKYSPYLITCPLAPQPTATMEYISDPGTYIGGNRCLASIAPLLTVVTLTTNVHFINTGTFVDAATSTSGSAPTSASSSYTITGFARGTLTNLGFSGETTTEGSPYNLSGSYNTQSYIFQQTNSTHQQGLWTWSANYANLSHVYLGYLNLKFDSSQHSAVSNLYAQYEGIDLGIYWVGYIPIPVPVPVGCLFQYNFGITSQVTALANAKIPVPVYNTSAGPHSAPYLKIGKYIYSPITALSASNSCYQQMLADGPGCTTSASSLSSIFTFGLLGTKTTSHWLKIGTNATAYYNGGLYKNLPIYINATNSLDINQFGTYAGALIGCEPQAAWVAQQHIRTFSRSVGTGGVHCGVIAYIPASSAVQSDGQTINIAGITSFVTSQLTLGGTAGYSISLVPTTTATGFQLIRQAPTVQGCTGYNNYNGGNNNFNGNTYGPTDAAIPGYPVNYCVNIPTSLGMKACQGAGLDPISCAYYVSINTSATKLSPLSLAYIVPIPGTSTLLTTNSVKGIDFQNATIFPYFIYNASIPSTYSQFTAASYLNLSYSIYSPNNYASVSNEFGVSTTGVEPFDIFSGSGLLANFSSDNRPSEIADFPISIGAASAATGYDEFPVVQAGQSVQTKTPVPLSSPKTSTTTFTDENVNPLLGAGSALNQNYSINNITYANYSDVDVNSGLPACTNDFSGGACYGDVNYTDTTILKSNLFVFGNINITDGAVIETYGHSIVVSGSINSPSSIIARYATSYTSVSGHGTLGFQNITNPAFIAESPNGFVYIINYTTNAHIFSTTTTAYVFKLRYLPTGYYNYSVFQPSGFASQSTLPKWLNETENYFRGSLAAQTPSLYIISESQFSSTSTPNLCVFSLCIGSASSVGTSTSPFLPLAAGADYQGDLFMVGAPCPQCSQYSAGSFALSEISASGAVIMNTSVDLPAGFVPSSEMAVSPGGDFVYLANASYPAINIYSTKGGTFQYVGSIPLSYSNATDEMDIHTYLANGGPFYNSQVASAYKTSYNFYDVPEFHHPIAITDVQGTLFVLDNWTFGPTQTSYGFTLDPYFNPPKYTPNLRSQFGSIWMLRAFEDNGTTEIPLGYSANSTVNLVSGTAVQPVNPIQQASGGYVLYPPYGQPLTANLSLDSGLLGGGTDTGPWVTSCEYTGSNGCTSYASGSGYSSIGPQITTLGQVSTGSYLNPEQLGVSSDFNGNIYLITHDSVSQTPYTQLLLLKPEIENYTTLEIGNGVPYQCYSSISSTGPCTTTPFISSLYPPLLGMPDSFEYLSGQGGPLQYFSIPSALSALIPTGAGSSSAATSVFNTGQTGGIDYNSLATSSLTSSNLPIGVPLRTYINSTISGYVVTPYTITYTLGQTWSFQNDGTEEFEINPEGATLLEPACYFNPDSKSGATTLYKNWVTALSNNFINQTIEGGSIYANYTALGANYQANLSDKNLILPPYLELNLFTNRLLGEVYINQTINSTTATSMSSQLEQGVLQNLGSISSLVGSFSGTGPKVINASRNYNYSEDIYIQVYSPTTSGQNGFTQLTNASGSGLSSFSSVLSTGCPGTFCAPAYLAQNATPTGDTPNDTLLGGDCGGSCPSTLASQGQSLLGTNLLPGQIGALTGLSGYYYSASGHLLSGNSSFNYSEVNETNYFSLFSLFHRAAYLYGLQLNLSSIPQIYGYNRLVYTYVDRFNNTIYMPVSVDFANITFLTLNTTSVVNASNVNQSQIRVKGSLDYIAANGILLPAPTGSDVYMYYDANLNYYNASAITNLAGTSPLSDSYYKWAENCAFDPQSNSCILANPLSTFGIGSLLQGNSQYQGLSASNLQTIASQGLQNLATTQNYNPNYAASGSSCAPEPSSLLLISQNNCNIHGPVLGSIPTDFGSLAATQLPSVVDTNGNVQYCVPQFSNGTGYLTSQIGLINTVATNSTGGFNDTITACGVGTGRIIAQYYGNPSPEPISVVQTNLPHSIKALSSNTANDTITQEYNYYFSPNATSSSFQIGSYQLNLGNLYAWVPIIIILLLLMASKSALGQSGGVFELLGFAALADLAAGAAAGSGRHGKGLRGTYRSGTLASTTYDRLKNVRTAKQNRATGRPPPKPVPPILGGPLVSQSAPPIGAGLIKMSTGTSSRTRPRIKPRATGTISGSGAVPQRTPPTLAGQPKLPPDWMYSDKQLNATLKSIDSGNYYTFLGLSTAPKDQKVLLSAYRNVANAYHPDRNKEPLAEAKFKVANAAYQVGKKKIGTTT